MAALEKKQKGQGGGWAIGIHSNRRKAKGAGKVQKVKRERGRVVGGATGIHCGQCKRIKRKRGRVGGGATGGHFK